MAYYFISLDPELFKTFVERFPELMDGEWIESKKQLEHLIHTVSVGSVFFVHKVFDHAEIDDYVLSIRDTLKDAKIVYVSWEMNAEDFKEHQETPAGGDAYISHRIEEKNFFQMLEGLGVLQVIRRSRNRLEEYDALAGEKGFDMLGLERLKELPDSRELDRIFHDALGVGLEQHLDQISQEQQQFSTNDTGSGESMTDKDQELSLDDLGDLELGDSEETLTPADDGGLELDFDEGLELHLGEDPIEQSLSNKDDDLGPSSDDLELSLNEDLESLELAPTGSLSVESLEPDLGEDFLSSDPEEHESLSLGEDDLGMDLSLDASDLVLGGDLSDDAKEKLKEIDAIMDHDASEVNIQSYLAEADVGLDESLVSDELNLDNIDFNNLSDELPVDVAPPAEKSNHAKRKKKDADEIVVDKNMVKEGPSPYGGDLERLHATIANLRTDREELLAKIQQYEDEKILSNRGALSLRAELDEKKIELSIVRRKLNDEISDLKDRLKLHDEKKLVLEEKIKILSLELDKANQKNKIDMKKVQMRERELEQMLELLKADSETQIRNRDLKILELKRKMDGMEFDMETFSQQEKKSLESRFELENKLEKTIKTLRGAISALENESDRSKALDAVKKNIDM